MKMGTLLIFILLSFIVTNCEFQTSEQRTEEEEEKGIVLFNESVYIIPVTGIILVVTMVLLVCEFLNWIFPNNKKSFIKYVTEKELCM